jgi:hypothetical protein
MPSIVGASFGLQLFRVSVVTLSPRVPQPRPRGSECATSLAVQRPILTALFASLALTLATDAFGDEAKTSSLSWLRMPGADTCVATQPLARAIEERLGRTVFVSASQADLSVEGRIEKRPAGGWHAVITVRDAKGATLGTRDLNRPDAACEAMTEPLALVVAVMIDPDAAMRPKPEPISAPAPEPRPVDPAPLPSPAAPAPAPPPDKPQPTPPREPWRFEGGVQATVNGGLLPSVAPGAGVHAILYPPGIPVGFRGYTTLFLPTDTTQDGARATFDMLYAGGTVCPTLRRRVNLLGCLGGQLGVLRPRAETTNRGISEDLMPVLNAVAEVRVHVPIVAPIGIAAGVGAGVPILRPELRYQRSTGTGTAVLHQPDAVTLSADVGLGLFFP